MADTPPLCSDSRAAYCCHVSRRALGQHHFRHPGFRDVRLSAGVLSPAKFLARRAAALESLQQRRAALPGPVEYADPLPPLAHLPAAALNLVSAVLLSGTPVLGRAGHVLPGVSLDRAAMGSRLGRAYLRVQRADAECPDVAEYCCHVRLAAVGGMAGATRLARGGKGGRLGGAGGRHANAGRRTGSNPADLGHPYRPRLRRLGSARGAAEQNPAPVHRVGFAGPLSLCSAIAAISGTADAFAT